MTSSKQTSFDVFRVAADGSIDEHRMTWPSAAHTERLKITVPEEIDPIWVASQLRKLAVRLENGFSESITPENTKHPPVSLSGPGSTKANTVEGGANEKAGN